MVLRIATGLIALAVTCISANTAVAQSRALIPLTTLDRTVPVLPVDKVPKGNKTILKHGTFSDLSVAVQTDGDGATPPKITCPADKAGLTDGFQQFAFSLTNDMAASLSLFGSGDLSASDKVILYQFAWYKDILASDGTVDGRCGAGVMLALRVSNLQANLSLTLPTLAATAQLGQSSISYKLGTFGLSGKAIDAAIPNATAVGKFDTDAYAAMLQTIAAVQASYRAATSDITVTPRPIAVSFPVVTPGADLRVAVQLLSIRQIAQGKTCREARAAIPGRNQTTDLIVEDTYQSISGTGCGTFSSAPSPQTRAKEAALLKQFGL